MDPTIAAQFQHSFSEEASGSAGGSAVNSGFEQSTQALGDKFQSMLAQGSPTQPVHANDAGHMVTQAVQEQASDYRQVPNDVMYMSQHMNSMSMERMAATNMTVQLEIASLNADLQVKMAAVQSSKDAVQTLMKNQ